MVLYLRLTKGCFAILAFTKQQENTTPQNLMATILKPI